MIASSGPPAAPRPLRREPGRRQLWPAAVAALAALALALPARAAAQDPGRWLLTGASSLPITYWQGLTSNPGGSDAYFVGVFQGLWRTDPQLVQTAGNPAEIPGWVTAAEGYNHIGDPTWNPGDGGRVLLPMECYSPSAGNTCGTGAFGVADPETLAFRYYVKLDPADIAKAMWAETSPDGSLVWTSSGDDLLAYRSSDIAPANAGPAGPLIRPVRRLPGSVPPSGVTGAAFVGGRLLLAGEANGTYQVWSVDTATGARRLEIELHVCGESEGLDTIPTLGGTLHWLIAPFDPGCELTFGPGSALLHFVPEPAHERFEVAVTRLTGSAPGEVEATVEASRDGHPLPRASVSFAGATARTGTDGTATVSAYLGRPGSFRAVVERGQSFGASGLVAVGAAPQPAAAPAANPR